MDKLTQDYNPSMKKAEILLPNRQLRNAFRCFLAREEDDNEDIFQENVAGLFYTLEEYGMLMFDHKALIYRRVIRDKAKAARMGAKGKRLGDHAGVPDVIIFSHRVAIELKVKNRKLSKEQKEWFKNAIKWGWRCYKCKTRQEIVDVLLQEGIVTKEQIGCQN